jgi:hypothetical protein
MVAECQWLTSVILTTWKAEIRRIMVQVQPWQIVAKTTGAKWTGDVAQAIKHQLCKHKTRSSNSSPTKKKKIMAWWQGYTTILSTLVC